MGYPNNNLWLKQTIRKEKLTRAEVATALFVDTSTVDRWLQPKTRNGEPNKTWRRMPDMARELMKYRLEEDWFIQ